MAGRGGQGAAAPRARPSRLCRQGRRSGSGIGTGGVGEISSSVALLGEMWLHRDKWTALSAIDSSHPQSRTAWRKNICDSDRRCQTRSGVILDGMNT